MNSKVFVCGSMQQVPGAVKLYLMIVILFSDSFFEIFTLKYLYMNRNHENIEKTQHQLKIAATYAVTDKHASLVRKLQYATHYSQHNHYSPSV